MRGPLYNSRASAPVPTLFAGAEKIGDDVGAFRHHFGYFMYSNMKRAVMRLARLSLSVVLLISLWHHGAQAARLSQLHRGTQAARILGELPPCKDVWGGIPGWDCFDPPTHDLPPCESHHQRAGIDCWPKSPPKAHESTLHTDHDASLHVEGALPLCKDVPGGIPNATCYDPPSTPLPPCDFKHQNAGIDCCMDCRPKSPPPVPPCNFEHQNSGIGCCIDCSPKNTPKAHESTLLTDQGKLPPCKNVPGGIPNWDCYDPPSTPLPPCDFKHQNPGIDCSTDSRKPKPPPASKAKQGVMDIADLL